MSPFNSDSENPDKKPKPKEGEAPVKYPNDTPGTKEGRRSLREHPNNVVRFFARAGFMVWVIVMVVGLLIAFGVSLFLV